MAPIDTYSNARNLAAQINSCLFSCVNRRKSSSQYHICSDRFASHYIALISSSTAQKYIQRDADTTQEQGWCS